jgi:hypothetical protein
MSATEGQAAAAGDLKLLRGVRVRFLESARDAPCSILTTVYGRARA